MNKLWIHALKVHDRFGIQMDTVHFTSYDHIFLVFAVYCGVACLDTVCMSLVIPRAGVEYMT